MSGIEWLQDENNMGFGAEESNSLLDHPNLAAAMKKMLEVVVIPIVKRIVGTMMENMVRKVVKEELKRAEERFFNREERQPGDEEHITQTQVQQLELQFLDKVCEPVYTGKEIKGEGGDTLRVVLIDPRNGSPVSSGPEASAKVEIEVLTKDENDDNVDGNFKQDESEDMGRPILSRNHVKLKEGIAVLSNIKFKSKAKWTKRCKISLMARMVNLRGIVVKEAATEPFLVMDCRCTLYKKHHPPSLSDEVWRLEKICRGSRLHNRLSDAKIKTVEDFLRSFNMNPGSLKAILEVNSEKFKVIVDHAQTCMTGEKLYLYNSTSCPERKAGGIFNVVGCLQGLLYEDKYVPVDKLSEDEKVDAGEITASAFEHWDEAEDIEASIAHLLSQSPNANGPNTSTSPRTETAGGSNGSNKTVVSAFGHTNFLSESSNASGADTLSTPRAENADESNLPIWKISHESDNVIPSTVTRHFSPVYSFDLDGFDFLRTDSMDVLSQGIDDPIHSRTVSEDFSEPLPFVIEQPFDQGPRVGGDSQMTGTDIAPPSCVVARQRWRMAIEIVAYRDMQARKKRRIQ